MARTNAALVQALLQQDYDTNNNPDLNQYITGASLFVNRIKTCAQTKGMPLTDDELEYIERCISAHAYCMGDPTYKQKSTSSASGGFFGQDGKGLEASRYGQWALRADISGCVEAYDKRKVAGAFWGGSCPAPRYPGPTPIGS